MSQKAPETNLEFHQFQQNCETCSLAKLCLPCGLDGKSMARLDALKIAQKLIQSGELLYQAEETFTTLSVLRSGALKSYRTLADGREQVISFTLAGEVIGFDGIKGGRHQVNTVALEVSSICELSFEQLSGLATEIPALQHHLFCLMSEKFNPEQTIDINSSATQRVASFLLNLSERLQRRGLSAKHFALPMARQDIANYLGLATETVSRIFSQLHTQNIVTVTRRDLLIKNFRQLQIMACEQ